MSRLLTLEPLAVSTLPSSFVAVTTIKRAERSNPHPFLSSLLP
ncbi:hypothetical protein glysoja_020607 [Glycine soja]|nr:hypothetical protein glysoja_020607 [Glycine soja]